MAAPLLYALHSGNLYGTERMALATAEGVASDFDPVIFAPPGPALTEAGRLGFEAIPFTSAKEFALRLRPWLARSRRVGFVATGLAHSLAAIGWNLLYRRRMSHLHIVHGGTDERLSYGRKRLLDRAGVTFVAVSAFVKERLTAHGVRPGCVQVIENFLSPERVRSAPRRGAFRGRGLARVVVVSRIDPIKRLDVLLDALGASPELGRLAVRILGTGWDLDSLRRRAAAANPNVTFAGFSNDVPGELAAADLLVHLCPVEPFGLAILEAMAAGIPALVPDTGGAASLVEDGRTGFHFRANDAADLAAKLARLMRAPAAALNRVALAARGLLDTRFSARARAGDYRRLLLRGLE